jgi:hypothetical protein
MVFERAELSPLRLDGERSEGRKNASWFLEFTAAGDLGAGGVGAVARLVAHI